MEFNEVVIVGNREHAKVDMGDYEYIYVPLTPTAAANLGVPTSFMFPCLRFKKAKEQEA